MGALKDYRSAHDKISRMLSRGEILKLKNGLYVRSRTYGGTVEPVEVANALYGPSYVSLEYALSHYGIIPEAVVTVTSVTSKRRRTFRTPLGDYLYEHIPHRAYSAGITFEKRGPTGVLIAAREKAVCDKLALTAHMRTLKQIGEFIIEDQRMDEDELSRFSVELLEEISAAYGLNSIRLFVRWFRKSFGRGRTSP